MRRWVGVTSPDRSGNTLDLVGKFLAARGARLSNHVASLPESEAEKRTLAEFRAAALHGPR